MKEYRGNAFNVCLSQKDDGTFGGLGELVILFDEPSYIMTADGVVRQRVIGDARIAITAKGLRLLAAHLTEFADNLDAAEAKITADAAP